ncbi:MxaD family protein [Mycolicibacterium moriokaense]|uniref:MxaD family protein n=1 Tax=Mycolicibacterium moriokaense TaxID=39691 RepID=A0AAD1M9P7_9MYCO|nr:SRPBCC family protein [Mycolicibacterium moriokaense]MCV7042869.1 SRPBCC family protein [Mycolicibacterium moriokaense]ORB16697.1 MxaD family protein [Mycolicibacterium moriokaense]BBX04579.1 MxaD family protein [Mycolicibacterium moriokaense]
MAEIARTRTIAAAPQEVWNVLADFGALSTWVDRADHSSILVHGPDGGPVGTSRRVQMGRNTLVETIVEFDPPRALAYEIDGLPKQLGRVTNRWSLRPQGDSTSVTLTSTVEIGSGPLRQLAERAVCRVMARESGGMLAGLDKRLENSRV